MTTATIAALHRLSATWAEAPRIVTVTRKPATALQPHVFGEQAVANLVLDEAAVLILPDESRTFADDAGALAAVAALAGGGLILRFVDPATLARVIAAPGAIEAAAVIWLQIRDAAARDAAIATLAARGFGERFDSALPEAVLLARAPIVADPAPRYERGRAARLETLVIVDNNLTGERGHYLSVATRIGEGARAMGAACVWAGNARLDAALAPPGVTVERVFATSIFDIDRAAQATGDLSPEIAAGWRAVAGRHDAAGTHFLVPTADGHFVRALHRMLAEGWTPVGVVHLATPYETRHMPSRHGGRELDWYLRAIAAHPLFGRRIFLWGETHALAALLAERIGARIGALPLPAPDWGAVTGVPADAPLTIVFLGEARLDKGAMELPAIAAALTGGGAAGAVRVRIQRVAPFGGYGDALEAAFAEVAGIAGVEIIDGALDEEGYRAAILGADAVLLPYRADNYRVRGSGILVEALAAGRIVLATAGTVAEEYAGDGIVLACEGAAGWRAAVAGALAGRDADRAGAPGRAHRFRSRHAARGYVDRLAFRAEFAQETPRPEEPR